MEFDDMMESFFEEEKGEEECEWEEVTRESVVKYCFKVRACPVPLRCVRC